MVVVVGPEMVRAFAMTRFLLSQEWEQEPSSTSSSRVDVVVDDVSGRLRALILAGDDGAGIGDGEIDEHFWANAAAAHAEQQQPAGDEGDESEHFFDYRHTTTYARV